MKIIATWSPCCKILREGERAPGVMHTAGCERRDHRYRGQTIPLVALADAQAEIDALKTEVDRMRDDRIERQFQLRVGHVVMEREDDGVLVTREGGECELLTDAELLERLGQVAAVMTARETSLSSFFHGGVDELVLWSFRYCLGRMTIASCQFAEDLARAWPSLREQTRTIIQRELEEAFRRDDEARENNEESLPLGWDCDRAAWQQVREAYAGAGGAPERSVEHGDAGRSG